MHHWQLPSSLILLFFESWHSVEFRRPAPVLVGMTQLIGGHVRLLAPVVRHLGGVCTVVVDGNCERDLEPAIRAHGGRLPIQSEYLAAKTYRQPLRILAIDVAGDHERISWFFCISKAINLRRRHAQCMDGNVRLAICTEDLGSNITQRGRR